MTVPQIARRMGLTRQSVQASVNRLRDDRLVVAGDNPDHSRSPLIGLTEQGAAKYSALERRQARWINELADGLDADQLQTAARALEALSRRIDHAPRRAKRRGGDSAATRDG